MAAAAVLVLSSCAGEAAQTPPSYESFEDVRAAADGQTVDRWMYGGDEQGNAYVDDVLAPAAAAEGVTLRRVPITDTADAVNRILSERQAGRTDGSVDLVWANGANFSTGRQAEAWRCGWTDLLPNMALTDQGDPLLLNDFGTPVDGCEAPWHKAQFTFFYNSATVADPPTTLEGILEWAKDNPGRFTYPAPRSRFTHSHAVKLTHEQLAGLRTPTERGLAAVAFDPAQPVLKLVPARQRL